MSNSQAIDYAALDPGIRETVRLLTIAGFETSDSGDGVSKPAAWYASGDALPFPHVVIITTPRLMVTDADRVARLLGPDWNVEANYETLTRCAHLLARTQFPEERLTPPVPGDPPPPQESK